MSSVNRNSFFIFSLTCLVYLVKKLVVIDACRFPPFSLRQLSKSPYPALFCGSGDTAGQRQSRGHTWIGFRKKPVGIVDYVGQVLPSTKFYGDKLFLVIEAVKNLLS